MAQTIMDLLQCRGSGFSPWVEKVSRRREWQPNPGEFHGQRSLGGYSPWDCKESGTTEQLQARETAFSNRIVNHD